MRATSRIEKHKGVTLIVAYGWLTVVWDATGHSVEGPVADNAEVKALAKAAVAFLKKLTTTSKGDKN